MTGKPDVLFTKAGTIKNVELNIMNLRRGVEGSSMQLQWEKIGAWRSWDTDNHGLDIQDIVWPGESHVPPQGVPEKFHMTIGFLGKFLLDKTCQDFLFLPTEQFKGM